MHRAAMKLQLSYSVMGDNIAEGDEKEATGVKMSDLRCVIFGLHTFDLEEINDEEANSSKLSELDAMAEKVIAIRHEQIVGEGVQKFAVDPNIMNGSDLVQGSYASMTSDSSLDEASYQSWIEKLKEMSQLNVNPLLERGNRKNLSEENKHLKLETARKKAEVKKLEKWEAHGYHSLSVRDPISPGVFDLMSDSGNVHFVYGDCTDPSKVSPSEPAFVFR